MDERQGDAEISPHIDGTKFGLVSAWFHTHFNQALLAEYETSKTPLSATLAKRRNVAGFGLPPPATHKEMKHGERIIREEPLARVCCHFGGNGLDGCGNRPSTSTPRGR